MVMTIEFPHRAPQGMHYEILPFRTNVVSIWIHYDRQFDYNNGQPVGCIWGFYHIKKKCYYAPINSSKCGDQVEIERTTPYSAMIPKQTPLEAAYV